MTRAKTVGHVAMILAVLVSIIAAATFQPRPSDRHSMKHPSAPSPGHGLRPRTDQRYTALADDLDERIRAGRLGTGGQVLDPADVALRIGRTPTAVRHALEQLARTGTVENLGQQWGIPDDHSTARAARRAHHLLEAMIDAGGYPPRTPLPPAQHLVDTLLTHPDAITVALHTLAADGVLEPVRQGFAVRERGRESSGPQQAGGRLVPLGADTAWDPHAIRHLCDEARERWYDTPCPSHHVLTQTEALQHDILHRLMLAADRHAASVPDLAQAAAVRAARARAVAARDTTVVSLGERHWRSAVLAGPLADLADSLSATARPDQNGTPCP
ncbi:hypothetical protein ACIBUR_29180 [Streptomyces anulatus]